MTNHAPRVWIGCLACYTDGRLIGDWHDAIDAAEVTPAEIHGHPTTHEELWCLDIENMLTDDEMSPAEATRQAEVLDDVPEHLLAAFHAWARSGCEVTDGDGYPSVSDFEERYAGHHDTFTDYARDYLEETQLLADIPDDVARHFSYDSYADDLKHGYTVLDAETGVYVFREL